MPERVGPAAAVVVIALAFAGCRGGCEPSSLASGRNDPPPSTHVAARLSVDCKAASKTISPLIYGIGFDITGTTDGLDPRLWSMRPSGRRMGGNQSSRYNWSADTLNSGNDWFFENQNAKRGADPIWKIFLDANAAHGAASVIEIPMLGWVAKDATSVSFPLAIFPSQQASEAARGAGNGRRPDGTELLAGDPTRTSVASTPEFQARWVREIARVAKDRPRVYVLDNEPALWNQTHRDVHPDPVTYDELFRLTREYALAIRDADPDAKIAGPAAWGWMEYSWSAKDVKVGVHARPDRRAHGDLPLLAWYLRQSARYEKEHGKKLIDILDVHFYPQADGVGIGTTGKIDAATRALRIRSTRALWDASYKDESWIAEPVRLLPRLREWIDAWDPGVRIQVGEWNFGAENDISGGLAVAEALARFADGGVTSAYYWPHPAIGSAAYFAFRAYRDFDGAGGRFLDELAPSESTRAATLWASRDAAGKHLVLVVLGVDAAAGESGGIDLSSCGAVDSVRAFTYKTGQSDFEKLAASPRDGGVAVAFAPYSMSIVDVRLR